MALPLGQLAQAAPIDPSRSPASDPSVARIVSVSGSQAVAVLERPTSFKGKSDGTRIEMGALMKIRTPYSVVVGVVSAISCPLPENASDTQDLELMELNLAGEIAANERTGKLAFQRGVANHPSVGDTVHLAGPRDLELVYALPDSATIEVGRLYQNASVSARLMVDELLGKHFVLVGATGCGKSSAMACILQSVLRKHEFAHIVILDVHNEYPPAFGNLAELIDPANLRLPFWLMNFEELSAALTGDDGSHNSEIEILGEAVLASKRKYAEAAAGRLRRSGDSAGITVDTPVPFRLSDVTAYIDHRLGALEKVQPVIALRRLKNRIETLASDPRINFMFGSLVIEDTMGDVLGRIFRIPVDGRPVTVINLALVPPEILDIVVSVISRLAFDFAVLSEGVMPLLLVCEEAHRYAPANTERFVPTRRALSRVVREGRKYGVSLGLVTQRPSDLDQTILSQCSTVIAMRLAAERDQQAIRANTHEGAIDLLEYLPLLSEREAIVLGEGVVMPTRIKFRDIGATKVATPLLRRFSSAWNDSRASRDMLDVAVRAWRRTSGAAKNARST
jgi:DNA helicase HerA-like ATPase